jgi:hypothetical protein
MNDITLRGFHEKETREAFHVCKFEDGSVGHFEQLVPYIEHIAESICDALRCDGLWLTRYVDGVPVHTAEFVPGRPTTYWYGTDCA